jgi:hypothetical protein
MANSFFSAATPVKPHLMTGSGGISAEIMDLRKDVDLAFDAVALAITAATPDLTALETGLATAQGDITALQGSMGTAQGDISTLQGSMSTAQSDIGTLQTTVGAIPAPIIDSIDPTAADTGVVGQIWVNTTTPSAFICTRITPDFGWSQFTFVV